MTDIKVIKVSPQQIKVVNVGAQGPQGAGVASGGTTGQYLRKSSDSDYATEWTTLSGGGDLLSTNNLIDLTSASAARTNLSVESTSELNTRDTNNRARENHTGTQSASTITGLATIATSGDYDDLSNKPSIPSGALASLDTVGTLQIDNGAVTVTKMDTASNIRTYINVEDGATADQTDAEIKTAYENNSDTNAFTDAEKTKLSGVATGAEVNQNAFTTIAVAGQSDIVADGKTDTLTFAGGGNVTITTDASTDTITISSSGGGGGGGSGDSWSDAVDANIVPDADSTRNLGSSASRFANGYIDDLEITNDIVVVGTVDGRDIASDGTKLDGIESGATADQTDAEIKTAYENNADTNAFTDAEKTKLGTVESNATAPDDTAFASSWNGVTVDAPTKNAVHDALASRSISFGFLVSGEDGTAKLKMNYAGAINSLDDLYCSSGSIDIEIRIAANVNDAGTVVTSLTGLTASSTPTDTSATGANTFTAGQYIFIITSSDSSSEGLNGTLNITRTG